METIKIRQQSNTICQTHKVTLATFIDCICDANYSGLNVTGNATDDELIDAFNTLYEEYCKLTDNATYSYQFMLLRKMLALDLKQLLAAVAMFTNDAELLKQSGYAQKNLSAQLKRDAFDLAQANDELEKMRNGAKDKAITRNDFTKWRIRISKFMGYPIAAESTLLSDFIEMDKEFVSSLKNGIKNG